MGTTYENHSPLRRDVIIEEPHSESEKFQLGESNLNEKRVKS